MKNRLRRSLSLVLIAFFPALAVPGLAESPPLDRVAVPNLKINVLVYNMANVPSPILAQAEQEASRIFNEAGIYPEWRDCPCSQDPGPTDLMLRIIPQLFGSTKSKMRNEVLGYAPVSEEGGVLATVFFHRVEAVTKGGSAAPVLGNAMAHELGHLLLGENAHSPAGIMRAYWNRDFLKLAKRGLLNFTTDQAELIRGHVSAQRSYKGTLPAPLMASLK